MLTRESKKVLINKNIQLINEYLSKITYEQEEKLFKDLQDIFFFYGIKEFQVRQILKTGSVSNNAILALTEVYGITNALLFQLKYKVKNTHKYTSDTNSVERE